MAIEPGKQRNVRYTNPYADYEYVGKGSRQPWRSMILPLVFGIVLLWFAWMRWHEIAAAEQTGATVSMTSLEWGVYNISGKWGIPVLFAFFGIICFYFGIHNYRRLEKMKRS